MTAPPILKLPAELLLAVTANFEHFHTFVAFAGTCRRFHDFYARFGGGALRAIARRIFPQEAFDFLELQRPGPRGFSFYQRERFTESIRDARVPLRNIEAVDRRLSDVPSSFGIAEARRLCLNDMLACHFSARWNISSPAELNRARRGIWAGMCMFAHLYPSPNRALTVLDTNALYSLGKDTYIYLRSMLTTEGPFRTVLHHFIYTELTRNFSARYVGPRTSITEEAIMDILSTAEVTVQKLCSSSTRPSAIMDNEADNISQHLSTTMKDVEIEIRNVKSHVVKVDYGVGPLVEKLISVSVETLLGDKLPDYMLGYKEFLRL